MKTFREFLNICEGGRSLKDILGPGVPSERPTSLTTLETLRRRNTSDLPRPRGSTSGVLTTPLNQATYQGRVEAGRRTNPKTQRWVDNPDYVGPTSPSQGTRDTLMPGTTPSLNPNLSPRGTKLTTKSTSKTSTKVSPQKPKFGSGGPNFI